MVNTVWDIGNRVKYYEESNWYGAGVSAFLAFLQAITICFMAYLFTKFQWYVLLLSPCSAKHVLIE